MVGYQANFTEASYATSSENLNTLENQKRELQHAVDDSIKVINSEVYFSYTSQDLKNNYENAIENAKLELTRQDASYDELRQATIRVNEAKKAIYDAASKLAQKMYTKNQLKKSIENNRMQVNVAKNLLENYPHTIKNVRSKLVKILEDSQQLISQAEALLEKL